MVAEARNSQEDPIHCNRGGITATQHRAMNHLIDSGLLEKQEAGPFT